MKSLVRSCVFLLTIEPRYFRQEAHNLCMSVTSRSSQLVSA